MVSTTGHTSAPYRPTRRALLIALACSPLLAMPVAAAEGETAPTGPRATHPPTGSLPAPRGGLPADTEYLAQTGHYLRGEFRDFWRAFGGSPRFGYPLSEEYTARGADGIYRTMQLFDRARFELHRGADDAWTVELGQLGREALGGQTFPGIAPFDSTAARAYFPATGHSLGGNFLTFWRDNEGERTLGYPLSEPIDLGDRTAQHFERGRLDYSPASGAVARAALGRELLSARGWPQPARIGLSFSDPAPGQGQTTIVELFADRPLTITGARIDDRVFTFFGDGIYHRAFLGFAPETVVGPHALTVEVRDAGGAKTLNETIRVTETNFTRDRVYLPPEQGELLDPDVAARELQIVAPLYAIYSPAQLWNAPFIVPADGPITTEFGEMRAYNDGPFASWHGGMDIGAPEGAPIAAPAPGRVVYTGPMPIKGNFTAIDHGLGILTCYFHQSAFLVTPGQMVQTGNIIGRVGTTGLSTGAHLHWEVRVQGVPVNPMQWVRGAGIR